MSKKKFILIILLTLFFSLLIYSYFFIQNARIERSWPFNSKLGKYLPKSVKYYAYKFTNPEDLIIDTFYYKLKADYFSIPSENATGNGGGIHLLKNNLSLIILENGEIFIFDYNKKSFLKIDNDLLRNKFNSIRDIFVKNNELNIVATKQVDENCQSLVLNSYEIDYENSLDLKIIFQKKIWESEKVCEDPLANNSGSRVVSKNGKYYVSTGYFTTMSSNLNSFPQDLNSSFGKILEIDYNGNRKIFSFGHRNPQGLFFYNNNLISSEHGPRGGDEINLIKKNQNYGWPCTTSGTLYSYDYKDENDMWPDKAKLKELGCKSESIFKDPLYTWTPSLQDGAIAPSQGIHYIGNYYQKFKKNLIIGSLAATSLFRMKLTSDFKIINIERINVNERIRDLIEISTGEIMLYTDGGSIVILSKL